MVADKEEDEEGGEKSSRGGWGGEVGACEFKADASPTNVASVNLSTCCSKDFFPRPTILTLALAFLTPCKMM